MNNIVIEFHGSVTLSIDDVWPDGDAPEEPHVRDVIEVMQASGSKLDMLAEWSLKDDLWVVVTDLDTKDVATY